MRFIFTLIISFVLSNLFGQTTTIEGYVFESGNRGYLNTVYVQILNSDTDEQLGYSYSNEEGFFTMDIVPVDNMTVIAKRDMFKLADYEITNGKEKMFVQIEMDRLPGYLFEVTLAKKRTDKNVPTDAIKNARIEIYNNTTQKEILSLIDHPYPEFNVNFQKGNHYTVLIRKPGFLSKRMEAYVDVEGCILCFDGVGNVQPGVSDNLTEGNAMGVLLANVELDPIFEGKTLEIENIYYGLGKWNITRKAREQLNKVIVMLEDNPNLTLELGSHTDSRGKSEFNRELSEKRAKSSVEYILMNSDVRREKVISRGYGEQVILNKCVDGVSCTEAEHSVNRRTELKILGINDIYNYKPLADMKREERLEREILELGNEGEVKVQEGETLEQAIARQEAERSGATSTEAAEEAKPIEAEEPKVYDAPAAEDVEEQMIEKVKEEVPAVEDVPAAATKKVEEATDGGMRVHTEQLRKKNISKAQEDKTFATDVNTIVSNGVTGINGAKVVILKSKKLVAASHEIYQRHNKLEVHYADDGMIWYLVGGFDNVDAAKEAHKNFMSVTYPDSYVVSFENGKLK